MKSGHTVNDLHRYANDVILVTDEDDKIIYANDQARSLFYGDVAASPAQRALQELLDPSARADFAVHWSRLAAEGMNIFETACRRADASVFPVEISARVIDIDGRRFYHSILRDIRGRRWLTAVSPSDWDVYASLLEHFPNPVWRLDSAGRGVYFNKAWLEFTGRTLEQELGDGWQDNIHPDDRDNCLHIYAEASREGRPFVREYRLKQGAEGYRWVLDRSKPCYDAAGALIGYVGSCHDIDREKQAQERIRQIGQYDSLTGLPNHTLLEDRLRQAIANARRCKGRVVALCADLDCFKLVNDSLGHTMGNRLLQAVARRLKGCLRESDTLSRRGGDEFVIILSELRHLEDAAHVAGKLLRCLAEPYNMDGFELHITASIGIGVYPDDSQDMETLIKNADAAMYYAKQYGRNRYQFFTQEMNSRAYEYLLMQNHLRRALERGEFELNYQPQVDLKRGVIVGSEALIRWRHPDLGVVSPGQFIPIAEENGLIVPIGEWVIQEACQQSRRWQQAGLPPLPVAVNLSSAQFRKDDFQESIERALQEHQLTPSCLELELTEGTVMQNAEDAILTLQELKAMGVRLSIDDFGTGYSSLSYLKRFPIDKLKVDRSFVQDITSNDDDAEITRAIIGMAHGLGLKVVAEGVEYEDQLKFLRWQKCDDMQGYYFSRPLQADVFQQLLAAGKKLNG